MVGGEERCENAVRRPLVAQRLTTEAGAEHVEHVDDGVDVGGVPGRIPGIEVVGLAIAVRAVRRATGDAEEEPDRRLDAARSEDLAQRHVHASDPPDVDHGRRDAVHHPNLAQVPDEVLAGSRGRVDELIGELSTDDGGTEPGQLLGLQQLPRIRVAESGPPRADRRSPPATG